MVEWRGEDRRPVRLQYRVNLKGAKAPKDYIQLVLDPAEGSMHIIDVYQPCSGEVLTRLELLASNSNPGTQ